MRVVDSTGVRCAMLCMSNIMRQRSHDPYMQHQELFSLQTMLIAGTAVVCADKPFTGGGGTCEGNTNRGQAHSLVSEPNEGDAIECTLNWECHA